MKKVGLTVSGGCAAGTLLEAKAARFALPPIRETLQTMPEDPATRGFVQAAVDELEAALAEYEARGWLRWLVPPPAEHKTRLRPWLFENIGYAEARAAELKGP